MDDLGNKMGRDCSKSGAPPIKLYLYVSKPLLSGSEWFLTPGYRVSNVIYNII